MSWKDILEVIKNDARYKAGILYGQPRKGHDEGSVENHIKELEQNLSCVETYVSQNESVLRPKYFSREEYWKLLVLIHAHDTFKGAGKKLTNHEHVSLLDPRSHASLAKAFLAEFTDDASMLAILQFHDEGHALRQRWDAKGLLNVERLNRSLDQVPDLPLFLIFTVIDGFTVSKMKDRDPRWFLRVVRDSYVKVRSDDVVRAYNVLGILEENHELRRSSEDASPRTDMSSS